MHLEITIAKYLIDNYFIFLHGKMTSVSRHEPFVPNGKITCCTHHPTKVIQNVFSTRKFVQLLINKLNYNRNSSLITKSMPKF